MPKIEIENVVDKDIPTNQIKLQLGKYAADSLQCNMQEFIYKTVETINIEFNFDIAVLNYAEYKRLLDIEKTYLARTIKI